MAKDYRYEKRKYVIGGMVLLVTFVYVLRLFDAMRTATLFSTKYNIRHAEPFTTATGNCWCSTSRPMM